MELKEALDTTIEISNILTAKQIAAFLIMRKTAEAVENWRGKLPGRLGDKIDAVIRAKQRKHDCPGFDCSICTPTQDDIDGILDECAAAYISHENETIQRKDALIRELREALKDVIEYFPEGATLSISTRESLINEIRKADEEVGR